MRRYSNLLSLMFLSVACVITICEYKSADQKRKKYVQLEMPTSLQEMSLDSKDTEMLENFTEASENKFSSPQLVKDSSNAGEIQTRTLQLSKGDTVSGLLTEVGFSSQDIELVDASLKRQLSKQNKIKPGQTFVISYQTASEKGPLRLIDLELNLSDTKAVIVKRTEQGEYKSKVETFTLEPVLKRAFGKINTSFYSTALKSGIPKKIVKDAISSLTYVMNFQHGIKRGDSFEILYEEHVDRRGHTSKIGNIRYIGFMAGSTYHKIYRMDIAGVPRYFDSKGQSIIRGLLQTPIDPRKMRITSGFCKNRLHPIHGFTRAHKGVDFGAPTGTEIKAAGDGVVVRKGYYGEYGHFVKIRHASGYETAYGHLSRYAQNITVGSKVLQNQLIGYVGATGNATGPHLHYEVIHKGVHVNPMGIKAMPALKLVGKDLKKFNNLKNNLETHLVGLTPHKGDKGPAVG